MAESLKQLEKENLRQTRLKSEPIFFRVTPDSGITHSKNTLLGTLY